MDLMSHFRMESLQPLIMLITPGATAVIPYVLMVVTGNDKIASFLDKHEFMFGTLVVLLAVAAGLILEDFGSLIESRIWDKLQEDTTKNEAVWWKYLRTAFEVEPMGQRYLRTILLRMKFELSFSLSLIPLFIGLVILNGRFSLLSGRSMKLVGLIVIVLAAYLLWESYQSASLLKRLHAALTDKIIIVGKDTKGTTE